MSKESEWTILNKTQLTELKKDTRIIILQNEQITKQLLFIRDEITKIKKEIKQLDNKYSKLSNNVGNINPFHLSRMQNTWLRLSRFNNEPTNIQENIDSSDTSDEDNI